MKKYNFNKMQAVYRECKNWRTAENDKLGEVLTGNYLYNLKLCGDKDESAEKTIEYILDVCVDDPRDCEVIFDILNRN